MVSDQVLALTFPAVLVALGGSRLDGGVSVFVWKESRVDRIGGSAWTCECLPYQTSYRRAVGGSLDPVFFSLL